MSLPPPSLQPIARDRPVGRYAPSPTGDLHLGNLRTALVAWSDCRRRGGIFILRIEDLDHPRKVAGAEERMLEDLRWLGIDWDEGPDVGGPAAPYLQSERSAFYQAALGHLESIGLTYRCTCSRKDLREASAPHERRGSEGPRYPGTCRRADPRRQLDHPLGASVRLRVDAQPDVSFLDQRLGPQHFNLETHCGDFILQRRDGLWAYQLACAVDDALMGVTHVLRGEDLLSSTPRQMAVMKVLGLTVPIYEHLPLVLDSNGQRMCKRDGSCSLRLLREEGLTPAQVRRRILNAPLSIPEPIPQQSAIERNP